jgi:aminoacylase
MASTDGTPFVEVLEASDAVAVERLQAYIRCKSMHPHPTAGYSDAGVLLEAYSKELCLAFERLELEAGHPIFLLTWEGSSPGLPPLLLNSHMDVVPVEADKWTQPPFEGAIIDGKMYGRGTQDMKSVGIQYLEAIRRLRASSYTPTRTIVLSYVPDEEVGGGRGMKLLLLHERMRTMKPAFVLDEGLASPDDKFSIFFGERKIWWLRVTAQGSVGHGSRLIPGTAVPKLLRVLASMSAFRDSQVAALEGAHGCGKQLGDFTSLNITTLHAGNPDPALYQYNVIPSQAWAGIDIRIPATEDLAAFKSTVDGWCAQDEGVTWEIVAGLADGALENPTTDLASAEGAPWYERFTRGLKESGCEAHAPSVFPAATDCRWIRLLLGVPALGFSPMRRTPILLHDHDEYIPVDAFLEGVRVYVSLLPHLADAGPAPGQGTGCL